MTDNTQVAFQITDEDLMELDAAVPGEYPSRAAVLRAAVGEWLARRRQAAIDAALERGYGDVPEDVAMTAGLSAVATRALAEAELEW